MRQSGNDLQHMTHPMTHHMTHHMTHPMTHAPVWERLATAFAVPLMPLFLSLKLVRSLAFPLIGLMSRSTQLTDDKVVLGVSHGKLIFSLVITGTGFAVHLAWLRSQNPGIRVLERPGLAQYGQLEMDSLPPTPQSSPTRHVKQPARAREKKRRSTSASSHRRSARDGDSSVRLLSDADHSASEHDDG